MRNSIKSLGALILLSGSIFATTKSYNFENPKQIIKITAGKSIDAPGQNIMKSCYFYDKYVIIEVNDPAIMGATSLKIYPITTKVNYNAFCKTSTNNPNGYNIRVESGGLSGYYSGKYEGFILTNGPDSFGASYPFQIFSISKQVYQLVLTDNQVDKEPFKFIKTKNGETGINYWRVVSSDCSLLLGNGDVCWQKILRDNKITQKLLRPKCTKEYKRVKAPADSPTQVLLHVEIPDLSKPLGRHTVSEKTKCYPSP